jgi:hypothetical protein
MKERPDIITAEICNRYVGFKLNGLRVMTQQIQNSKAWLGMMRMQLGSHYVITLLSAQ